MSLPLKKRELDLADIQGNIIRPYGRFGFPFIRHLFFNIGNAKSGRYFIGEVRNAVTTSERWADADGDQSGQLPLRPLVAVNVGLSFLGLLALELPTRTLGLLPHEFIDGMAKRCSILGDIGPSAPGKWDPIWVAAQQENSKESQVHIWVSLTARAKEREADKPDDALEQKTSWLRTIAQNSSGVTLLSGHKGPNPDYQDSAALMAEISPGKRVPTAKEHFGYTDGVGDPVFAGQYAPDRQEHDVIGSGKLPINSGKWVPLATGEFILGHFNEAQELPPSAPPWSFMRSGTFMAYRKLHQNIVSFKDYAIQQASLYRRVMGSKCDEEAKETVLAKMVGRWSNGLPLMTVPTYQDFKLRSAQFAHIPAIQLKKNYERSNHEKQQLAEYERFLVDFRYADDADGVKCPMSSHIRRANPRDALAPEKAAKGAVQDTSLSNRRRILRRGLPYGIKSNDDRDEHGVAFMAMCASLFNQFEFIQQQWMHYGSTFGAGNDTDPIVGARPGINSKFVIPSDPNGTAPPFICANMPLFVETRGGEYFFIPSLTALRQIAEGSVDPT